MCPGFKKLISSQVLNRLFTLGNYLWTDRVVCMQITIYDSRLLGVDAWCYKGFCLRVLFDTIISPHDAARCAFVDICSSAHLLRYFEINPCSFHVVHGSGHLPMRIYMGYHSQSVIDLHTYSICGTIHVHTYHDLCERASRLISVHAHAGFLNGNNSTGLLSLASQRTTAPRCQDVLAKRCSLYLASSVSLLFVISRRFPVLCLRFFGHSVDHRCTEDFPKSR